MTKSNWKRTTRRSPSEIKSREILERLRLGETVYSNFRIKNDPRITTEEVMIPYMDALQAFGLEGTYYGRVYRCKLTKGGTNKAGTIFKKDKLAQDGSGWSPESPDEINEEDL